MAGSAELKDLLDRGYRYALALTHHEDDAYDMVQEAYVKICEKNKPLIISYLIATIRNIHLDRKRKEKSRRKWFSFRIFPQIYVPKLRGEPVLERLLANLKERDREILMLAVVEEFTAQEIADLLDMPRGTVLTILSRTKKKLKSQLTERYQLKNE